MAIPISDLQKQIQVPSVAKGQASNFAEEQKKMFAPAFKIMEDISSAAEKGMAFVVAQRKADNESQANDAYNKYLTERENLWLQMSQKKQADALKFNDEYMQQSEASYDKAMNAIDNISDPEIREAAREQINKYNLNMAAKKDMYLYGEKTTLEENNYIAKRDKKIRDTINSVNVYDMQATNQLLQDAFNTINKDASLHYATRGYTPEQINEKIIKEQSDLILQSANQLAYQSLSDPKFSGFNKALNLLYANKDNMDRETYINGVRNLENQNIKWCMQKDPNSFIKDGKIDLKKISQMGKHLTEWEEWQLVQGFADAQQQSKSLSDDEKIEVEDITRRKELETYEYLSRNNIKTKKYYIDLMNEKGLKEDDVAKIMADDRKDLKVSDLIQIVTKLRKEEGIKVQLSTGKTQRITSTTLRKMREEAEELLYDKIRLQQTNRENKRPGFMGGVTDIIFGENPTVREFLTERVMDYFTATDANGSPLLDSDSDTPVRNAGAIDSALTYMEQYAQANGFNLNDNIRDAEKTPGYRDKLKMFAISSAEAATNISSGFSVTDPASQTLESFDRILDRKPMSLMDHFYENAKTSYSEEPLNPTNILYPLQVNDIRERNRKALEKLSLKAIKKRIDEERIVKDLFKTGEIK